jgi:hypothetical protein
MIKAIEHAGVYLTVWYGEPTIADVDETLRAAQTMYARLGRPLVLVGVLTPSTAMPSAPVMERMMRNWPLLLRVASTMQYVNLDGGREISLLTATRFIGFLIDRFVFARHGKRVTLQSDLDSALKVVCEEDPSADIAELRRSVDTLLAQLREERGSRQRVSAR